MQCQYMGIRNPLARHQQLMSIVACCIFTVMNLITALLKVYFLVMSLANGAVKEYIKYNKLLLLSFSEKTVF